MAALSIQVPYPVFYDRDGQPLDNGNIYIGVANLDPVTNPLQVYYDEALTITASQPLITSGGYVYRNGTPTQLYVNATDFSITVNDSKNLFVYNFPEATGIGSGASSVSFTGFKGQVGTVSDLADGDGSDWIGFTSAGTGAVARSAQDKMRDVFSVKDFGAIGDGVTDDSNAIEAAILAAYNAATLESGLRRGAAIYFPRGQYRIAQSSKLFSTIPSAVGGAASFHFFGEGANDSYSSNIGASVLVFDPPTSATTEYMINNNNKIAWSRFENLGFVSANGGTFWNGPTGAGIQSFEFRSCGFRLFTDIFNIGGGTNNSEWSFFQCKFNNFAGKAFYLNNEQAVNWRFYGCDAEVFSGILFEYNRGANVVWHSGSIIPTASTARIVKVAAAASGIGINNSPHLVFQSARFEMRDNAIMTEKLASGQKFFLTFSDCGMGGFNIPTSPSIPKVLYWRGAGVVRFLRCNNMTNYLWDYSTPGDQSEESSQLNVVMQDCDPTSNFLSGSTFVLSSAAGNAVRYPIFSVQRSGTQFEGVYRPNGNSFEKLSQKPNSVSFSSEGNQIALLGVGAGWPNIQTLNLPPALITKVYHSPGSTASFGGSTATITIKSAAGVTLFTTTYTMNSGALVPAETLISHKVDPANPFVTIEFSSSYVGGAPVPFIGSLFLTY